MIFLRKLLMNLWKEMNWRNSISCLLVIGFFVFGAWVVIFPILSTLPRSHLGNSKVRPWKEGQENAFSNIKLEAKAVYVFDILKNKPLFELNANVQLPLASLAKIMTVIVSVENLPSYLLGPIPREAILTESDNGVFTDEKMLVADLAEAMLVSS